MNKNTITKIKEQIKKDYELKRLTIYNEKIIEYKGFNENIDFIYEITINANCIIKGLIQVLIFYVCKNGCFTYKVKNAFIF